MKPEQLSDDAVRLYIAFFRNPGNTLRFGGDHAEKEISPRGREALNQLVEIGAAKTIQPDDQYPNREHYGGTDVDLLDECRKRTHLNPFTDKEDFVVFQRKDPTSERNPNALPNVFTFGPR